MTMNKVVFVFCVFGTVVLASGQPQSVDFPRGITLTIDRHPGLPTVIEEDDAIAIRCTFTNSTKEPLSFLLADHSDYHGTLAFPVGMVAKVTDKDRKILTHTTDFGDWWSRYFLSSDLYREMPGDRVTLKPGEKVVRIVPLQEVLGGLKNLQSLLRAGEYTVELNLGDITSNPFRFRIVAKKK